MKYQKYATSYNKLIIQFSKTLINYSSIQGWLYPQKKIIDETNQYEVLMSLFTTFLRIKRLFICRFLIDKNNYQKQLNELNLFVWSIEKKICLFNIIEEGSYLIFVAPALRIKPPRIIRYQMAVRNSKQMKVKRPWEILKVVKSYSKLLLQCFIGHHSLFRKFWFPEGVNLIVPLNISLRCLTLLR